MRNELPDREVFYTLLEVRVPTEQYRMIYDRTGPHSSLGCTPPAPETYLHADRMPIMVRLT